MQDEISRLFCPIYSTFALKKKPRCGTLILIDDRHVHKLYSLKYFLVSRQDK